MFRWGIIFLVIALIAAALGFGGLDWQVQRHGQLKLSSLWVLFCSWSACLRVVDVRSKRNIPSTK